MSTSILLPLKPLACLRVQDRLRDAARNTEGGEVAFLAMFPVFGQVIDGLPCVDLEQWVQLLPELRVCVESALEEEGVRLPERLIPCPARATGGPS